ncbi:hypothetical protein EBZ37_10860 [bacterium]|nr:hypothetical protein [bacterium]
MGFQDWRSLSLVLPVVYLLSVGLMALFLKWSNPSLEAWPLAFPMVLVLLFMLELFDSFYTGSYGTLEAKRVQYAVAIPTLVLSIFLIFFLVDIARDFQTSSSFDLGKCATGNFEAVKKIQETIEEPVWVPERQHLAKALGELLRKAPAKRQALQTWMESQAWSFDPQVLAKKQKLLLEAAQNLLTDVPLVLGEGGQPLRDAIPSQLL